MPGWLTLGDGWLCLSVRVQPRARRDGIAGLHDHRLRLRVAAVPEGGAANARLLRFVAGLFGVPLRQVTLLSGHGSRDKRLRIDGVAALPAGLERLRRESE